MKTHIKCVFCFLSVQKCLILFICAYKHVFEKYYHYAGRNCKKNRRIRSYRYPQRNAPHHETSGWRRNGNLFGRRKHNAKKIQRLSKRIVRSQRHCQVALRIHRSGRFVRFVRASDSFRRRKQKTLPRCDRQRKIRQNRGGAKRRDFARRRFERFV